MPQIYAALCREAPCTPFARQKVDAFYLTCKGTGVSGRLRGRTFTFLTKNPGPFMFQNSELVTWPDPGVSREQGS
jgi:hypothetical protein